MRTRCARCGLHLGGGVYSCDGFTDGYDQRACRCDCHDRTSDISSTGGDRG